MARQHALHLAGPERQAADLARELQHDGSRERAAQPGPEAFVERRDARAESRRHGAEQRALRGHRLSHRRDRHGHGRFASLAPDPLERRAIEPRQALGLEARVEDGGHERCRGIARGEGKRAMTRRRAERDGA